MIEPNEKGEREREREMMKKKNGPEPNVDCNLQRSNKLHPRVCT